MLPINFPGQSIIYAKITINTMQNFVAQLMLAILQNKKPVILVLQGDQFLNSYHQFWVFACISMDTTVLTTFGACLLQSST